ncbi:FKBP-type peptidylprolyl isomerase [Flavobacterium sp. F-328]|uniref:FKBP-type peptidylprolyl isomerase n=1 Tax=Flavobacterium erciyesense TaxID=2825842 RepID=A0ABS5D3L8_9FLAO|nr:FKBP-type peptidylprolyl isomerase [Flavobacterium erciyesense]MBQ0908570.1 FKBP-type peptidylprolyl isomerase [Flavobacterium erciyesense]
MNKFKYYFILLITTVSLFSCSKDEAAALTPPKAYADQYATESVDIEDYLKTYYIEDTNPDVLTKISKIPAGGTQIPVWNYLNSSSFPKLLMKKVTVHDVEYKLYYIMLREGTGQSPTSTDGVLTAYRGEYLSKTKVGDVSTLTSTFFEEINNQDSFFVLPTLTAKWGNYLPEFKTGNYSSNPDGTISYSNYGAGVMIIPSALAYYAGGANSIPPYAPLVFSFKLYEISRSDTDGDGVLDVNEDLDGDGYMFNYANKIDYPTFPVDAIRFADDTDKDGIPNYLDTDDDGDGVSTRTEITVNGKLIPFADIPSCDGNVTNPARIKRHLVKCN